MPQTIKLDSILPLIEEVIGTKPNTQKRAQARKAYVGHALLEVPVIKEPAVAIAERFANRGILSPRVMAERLLGGVDLDAEARSVGLEPVQIAALYQGALDALTPEVRAALEDAVSRPRPEGAWSDKRMKAEDRRFGIERAPLQVIKDQDLERIVKDHPLLTWSVGPTSAVDLRPTLGPARNQAGRGTCTAFGGTAVL